MHQLFMFTQHGMEGVPRLVQHGLQVIVGARRVHKDEHFSLSIKVQLVSTWSFPGSTFKIKAGAILKSGEQFSEFGIEGPKTTVPFLREVLEHNEFQTGKHDTGFVERFFGAHTSGGRENNG